MNIDVLQYFRCAGVAQLAEQLICNQQVVGSSPITSSILLIILLYGGVPEWLKGADCKSVASRFDGSNPSPTTILIYTVQQDGFFVPFF